MTGLKTVFFSQGRYCFWFFLCFCFACNDTSFQSSDTLKNGQPKVLTEDLQLAISQQLNNAAIAEEKEQLDSAIYWFNNVCKTYTKHQQWDSLYVTLIDAFYTSYYASDYQYVKPLLKNYYALIPAEQDTIRAKTLETQGFIAYREGRTLNSLNHYTKAADIWNNYPASTRLAGCYNMLGILYNILEDYPLAEQIYREGAKISHQLKDTLGEKKNLNNLGRVLLSQGQWEASISMLKKAQALSPSDDGFFEAKIAEAYLVGNHPRQALPLARKALQLAQKNEGYSALGLNGAWQIMGDVMLELGQTDAALEYYQLMMEMLQQDYLPGHREIAKGHIFIGQVFQEKKMWQQALQEYQTAIKIFLPSFEPTFITECPSSEDLLSREGYLMEALRYKGEVLLQQYEQDQLLSTLEAASQHFNTAVEFINQVKLYFTELEAKSFSGEKYSIPYSEDAIQTALLLFEKTGNPVYQERAFQLAQQATAFLLREAVNDEQAQKISNLPADTLKLLNDINKAISETQRINTEEESSIVQDSLTGVLVKLKRERLALMDVIAENYPTYYQLKHKLAPISLTKLQEELPFNTLVLKYFLGEKRLYCFALTEQGLQYFTAAVDNQLFDDIEIYRKTLSDLDYIREEPVLAEQQFINSSQRLYSKLLAPALSAFSSSTPSKLVIIPDGVLNYLSFECMLSRPVDTWLETDAFLVSDYTVRYAYYTGLLLAEAQQTSTNASSFLGFGTEYNDETLEKLEIATQDSVENTVLQDAFRGKKLSKLLYADDEAIEIANMLSGKSLVNAEATKTNFLKNAADYSMLHIAAHSFIDSENDSTAFIIFNQDKEQEDNLLSLQEVYQLNLNADLVTLSGCQTSSGALKRSEGVMSMARAFHFAGSSSLVASQWSIVDRSSFVIMKIFYENLKEGLPKDEALQKAKLAYLNSDELSSPAYRIPAYWAALIMVGDEQALTFSLSGISWYYLLGIGFLLLGLWSAYRKMRT